ncbi:uncharacterized protein KY384_007554 [Bacidia gigantensis]|uniref:uncharacterized protein n=1 Tax=Bacidia gigantensis TaxID=2732470 RepID=UPI001D0500A7|nr:uncharacterized protein KY384_007554 [Bacidia gigantensis]KAG8527402.1 hypothetical protein KY384_007554 [Bacidia gigantensis]
MLSLIQLSLTISAFSIAISKTALLHGRDINHPLQDSYDYIVVGCGISGLVVTNRLSEDSSRTVLCIEAGDAYVLPTYDWSSTDYHSDHYEDIIQNPVYVGSDIGGIYDWRLATTPQTQLDGAARPMPQGKALGGGSILNAMCWNRGGADDYDAWEQLGNPGWGWEGMLPYFRKSETYTPVYSQEVATEYSINYNPAVHGSDGPVQVSYPHYFYPQSANLFEAMNNLGIPTQFDPNDGTSAGPALVPTDLDPNNQTRSDARRTYFDPYVYRDNFHVITGQHVTRVLIEGVANNSQVSRPAAGGNENGEGGTTGNNEGFGFGPEGSTPPIAEPPQSKLRRQNHASSNLRIQGVEVRPKCLDWSIFADNRQFASSASDERHTVYATREVIVAAGSLHSAQLLQLSGIGPSFLLQQYNIPVAIDSPGVGNNLQDHCLVGTFYPYNNASYPSPSELTTNDTYNQEAEAEYRQHKTGPWTSGSPNALAFNPLSLISTNAGIIIANATRQGAADFLVANLDSTVIAGYAAQKNSLASRIGRNDVAAYEIINNNAGSLTVAVMHPLSRGTCRITSPDPFEPPAIDPRWLTNPVDRQVLVEALRFNREILAQPSMQELRPAQFVPPIDADEAALNQVINNGLRTEFHPSGTLAMLPQEQGGVVNSHLLVYGTQNLRVVDASIFPLIPAAHLQAVVYGVAEKAADIIKADNLAAVNPHTTISSTHSLASSSAVSSVTPSASILSFTNSSSPSQTMVTPTSLTSLIATISSASQPSMLSETSRVTSEGLTSSVSSFSLANLASTTSPSPFQSVMVFSLTIPTELPAQLSTVHIGQPVSTPAQTTTPAVLASSTGSAAISESVADRLTSAGVPEMAATSLAPVIVGSPPENGASATNMPDGVNEQIREAAIDAIIQWILSYLRSMKDKP